MLDFFIFNVTPGAWHGRGTAIPQVRSSRQIYSLHAYVLSDQVDTPDLVSISESNDAESELNQQCTWK